MMKPDFTGDMVDLVRERWARIESIGRGFSRPVIQVGSADVIERLFIQPLVYGLTGTIVTGEHVYWRRL